MFQVLITLEQISPNAFLLQFKWDEHSPTIISQKSYLYKILHMSQQQCLDTSTTKLWRHVQIFVVIVLISLKLCHSYILLTTNGIFKMVTKHMSVWE